MRLFVTALIVVPMQAIIKLGRINARETAAKKQTAERVAKNQLQKKAGNKGANVVIGLSVTHREVFAGHECIVSGIAAKAIEK